MKRIASSSLFLTQRNQQFTKSFFAPQSTVLLQQQQRICNKLQKNCCFVSCATLSQARKYVTSQATATSTATLPPLPPAAASSPFPSSTVSMADKRNAIENLIDGMAKEKATSSPELLFLLGEAIIEIVSSQSYESHLAELQSYLEWCLEIFEANRAWAEDVSIAVVVPSSSSAAGEEDQVYPLPVTMPECIALLAMIKLRLNHNVAEAHSLFNYALSKFMTQPFANTARLVRNRLKIRTTMIRTLATMYKKQQDKEAIQCMTDLLTDLRLCMLTPAINEQWTTIESSKEMAFANAQAAQLELAAAATAAASESELFSKKHKRAFMNSINSSNNNNNNNSAASSEKDIQSKLQKQLADGKRQQESLILNFVGSLSSNKAGTINSIPFVAVYTWEETFESLEVLVQACYKLYSEGRQEKAIEMLELARQTVAMFHSFVAATTTATNNAPQSKSTEKAKKTKSNSKKSAQQQQQIDDDADKVFAPLIKQLWTDTMLNIENMLTALKADQACLSRSFVESNDLCFRVIDKQLNSLKNHHHHHQQATLTAGKSSSKSRSAASADSEAAAAAATSSQVPSPLIFERSFFTALQLLGKNFTMTNSLDLLIQKLQAILVPCATPDAIDALPKNLKIATLLMHCTIASAHFTTFRLGHSANNISGSLASTSSTAAHALVRDGFNYLTQAKNIFISLLKDQHKQQQQQQTSVAADENLAVEPMSVSQAKELSFANIVFQTTFASYAALLPNYDEAFKALSQALDMVIEVELDDTKQHHLDSVDCTPFTSSQVTILLSELVHIPLIAEIFARSAAMHAQQQQQQQQGSQTPPVAEPSQQAANDKMKSKQNKQSLSNKKQQAKANEQAAQKQTAERFVKEEQEEDADIAAELDNAKAKQSEDQTPKNAESQKAKEQRSQRSIHQQHQQMRSLQLALEQLSQLRDRDQCNTLGLNEPFITYQMAKIRLLKGQFDDTIRMIETAIGAVERQHAPRHYILANFAQLYEEAVQLKIKVLQDFVEEEKKILKRAVDAQTAMTATVTVAEPVVVEEPVAVEGKKKKVASKSKAAASKKAEAEKKSAATAAAQEAIAAETTKQQQQAAPANIAELEQHVKNAEEGLKKARQTANVYSKLKNDINKQVPTLVFV